MIKNYNRIKEVLKNKGIKQAWLADRLGMTFRNLAYMLSNQRQPSIEVLYQISFLIGADLSELLVPMEEVYDNSI